MNQKFIDYTKIYSAALSQRGKAYKWGAKPDVTNKDPEAFDCSGFVRWVYSQVGVFLPEGSSGQYEMTKPLPWEYYLQTGDVGFFLDQETRESKHIGMLLDENMVVEARGFEPSLEAQNIRTNCVIMRPREKWENWKEFSGWRRFVL